jgi:predicted nucleic acid-binding protein
MNIFIDTSAFFALLDGDDAHHKKSKEAWVRVLKPENNLVTTSYVLVESFALIQSRLGMGAVKGFQNDILPLISIEWVGENVQARAVSALLAASKKSLSLVDCVSFEVIRQLGISTVFCFDPHFSEQGFSCVP